MRFQQGTTADVQQNDDNAKNLPSLPRRPDPQVYTSPLAVKTIECSAEQITCFAGVPFPKGITDVGSIRGRSSPVPKKPSSFSPVVIAE